MRKVRARVGSQKRQLPNSVPEMQKPLLEQAKREKMKKEKSGKEYAVAGSENDEAIIQYKDDSGKLVSLQP